MKITQVEPQKKNPRRFNVFLDGQFAFGADEDTVVNHRLVIGKEIQSDDLPKLLFETEIGKLMERMYNLYSIRQRSEKEVRDYLRNLNFKRKTKDQEQVSALVIDSLIERLKQKGLVNDTQFAASWMDARRKSKNKGVNAIKAELYQKGISRDIIEETITNNQSPISETDLAKQALGKKMRVWKNLDPKDFKQKGLEFLVRRGFDYDVAKEVVSEQCDSIDLSR